jgi:hypothetical protein
MYMLTWLWSVDRQQFLLEEDEFNRILVHLYNYPILSTLKYIWSPLPHCTVQQVHCERASLLSNRLTNEVITMGAIELEDRKLVNINIYS